MDPSFPMPPDERQAALFDRLCELTAFEPKHLSQFLGVPNSRRYRMVEGTSPLSFFAAHDLLRLHPDSRVALELAEALVELSPVRLVALDESIDAPTDRAMADALDDLARFFRQRSDARADGALDVDEQQQQCATIKHAMRMLHAALASLMSERVRVNVAKLRGPRLAGGAK